MKKENEKYPPLARKKNKKTVWFIEAKNGKWLVNKHNWTTDPMKATQFNSENEAVEYMIYAELMNHKATCHEFIY